MPRMLRVTGKGDSVARTTSSGWIWKLPALLCGRTIVCDECLGNCHPSPLIRRDPGFRNALVQIFVGGNTMMLNRAGIALARAAAGQVVLHDWWLYQLISGTGGHVIYDEVPLLLYRQHGTNQVGASTGAGAKLRRMRLMLRGRFHRWNGINLAALAALAHRLTPENRAILEGFTRMQRAGLIERLRILRQLRLYRQELSGTLPLWLAALLGRI